MQAEGISSPDEVQDHFMGNFDDDAPFDPLDDEHGFMDEYYASDSDEGDDYDDFDDDDEDFEEDEDDDEDIVDDEF